MKPRKAFPLRIEPGLYQALEAWAQQDLRSVNGQIEFILKQAVQKHRGKSDDEGKIAHQEAGSPEQI